MKKSICFPCLIKSKIRLIWKIIWFQQFFWPHITIHFSEKKKVIRSQWITIFIKWKTWVTKLFSHCGNKSMRNYEKNNAWNIRRLVDELFAQSTQGPSKLYWRLSDFCCSVHCVWLSDWPTGFEINLEQMLFDHLCLAWMSNRSTVSICNSISLQIRTSIFLFDVYWRYLL